MKLHRLALAAALLAACPAAAEAPLRAVPLGYCQISGSSASTLASCSGGIPAGATNVVISVETNAIRWRDDGTTPTASVGMPLATGAAPYAYAGVLSALQFIPQTGSAVIDVSFYR